MGIDVAADLSVQLDTANARLQQMLKYLAQAERFRPRYLETAYGFTVGSAATVAQDLGGPSLGRLWQVTRFTCDQSSFSAAAATGVKIGLMTAASGTLTAGEIGAINLEWAFSALPACDNWGRGQFVVLPTEHVYVVVFSASANVQVGGQIAVIDEGQPEPLHSVEQVL